MPLYELIFLKEPEYMSKSAMSLIYEYEDYYFSLEGTYLRMYGGCRAPSLMPRYAMDYIFHKEEVR